MNADIMNPTVSVILLVWNGERFIQEALEALLQQTYEPLEVIVVDNHSEDGSLELLRAYGEQIHLIENDYNWGFAGGNNVGLHAAQGDIVILLNQDAIVQPGWIQAIVDTYQSDPSIGIVGCKTLYPNNQQIQHAGAWVRPDDAFAFHIGQGEVDQGQYDTLQDATYVTGAAFAIHRRVLQTLGGLDSRFYPAFYEETDYCFQARRAGFRIVYQPEAVVHHYETTSLPQQSYRRVLAFHRNRVYFLLRHWDMEALAAFVAAEEKAIAEGQWVDDLIARSHAYWENRVRLSEIAQERHDRVSFGAALTPGQVQSVAAELQSLRQHALDRVQRILWVEPLPPRATPEVPPPPSLTSFQPPQEELPDLAALEEMAAQPASLSSLDHSLAHLEGDYQLREHQFHSNIPFLGGLIARFRSLINSISTRWYVLPVLTQQSQFNQHILSLFKTQRKVMTELADQQENYARQLLLRDDQLLMRDTQLLTQQNQLFEQQQQQIINLQLHIDVIDRRLQNTQWVRQVLSDDDAAAHSLKNEPIGPSFEQPD